MSLCSLGQFVGKVSGSCARVLHDVLGEVLHRRVSGFFETEYICYEAYYLRLEGFADVLQPFPGSQETPDQYRKEMLRYGVEVRHKPVGVLEVTPLSFDDGPHSCCQRLEDIKILKDPQYKVFCTALI